MKCYVPVYSRRSSFHFLATSFVTTASFTSNFTSRKRTHRAGEKRAKPRKAWLKHRPATLAEKPVPKPTDTPPPLFFTSSSSRPYNRENSLRWECTQSQRVRRQSQIWYGCIQISLIFFFQSVLRHFLHNKAIQNGSPNQAHLLQPPRPRWDRPFGPCPGRRRIWGQEDWEGGVGRAQEE